MLSCCSQTICTSNAAKHAAHIPAKCSSIDIPAHTTGALPRTPIQSSPQPLCTCGGRHKLALPVTQQNPAIAVRRLLTEGDFITGRPQCRALLQGIGSTQPAGGKNSTMCWHKQQHAHAKGQHACLTAQQTHPSQPKQQPYTAQAQPLQGSKAAVHHTTCQQHQRIVLFQLGDALLTRMPPSQTLWQTTTSSPIRSKRLHAISAC